MSLCLLLLLLKLLQLQLLGSNHLEQSVLQSISSRAIHCSGTTNHLGLLLLLQFLVKLSQRRSSLVMRVSCANYRAAPDAGWTGSSISVHGTMVGRWEVTNG